MHDARVLRNSPLFTLLTAADHPSNYHVIGDSAYPLLKTLMTPFRDNGHLTNAEKTYNIKLCSVRSIIERTFGALKGKFRRLKFLDMTDLQLANKVIGAACVLHNFMIDHGELNVQGFEELNVVNEYNFINNGPVVNEAVDKRNTIVALFQ